MQRRNYLANMSSSLTCRKGRDTKGLANRGDHPHTQKGSQISDTTYRGIYLLSLSEEVYAKCLENRCREISRRVPNAVFVRPDRSTTHQIFTVGN